MLAAVIEHTLLAATATEDDIRRLCDEAREWRFAAVCVNPLHVALARGGVRDTAVRVCAVVGYPLGATTTAAKIAETLGALEDGAREVDVVSAIGLLRGRAYGRYRDDLAAVIEVARRTRDAQVGVIIEAGLLTRDEKLIAAQAAAEAGADFITTATGMLAGGATPDDLRLLRAALPQTVRLKASEGIRTLAQARALVGAGADRLGTSAGIAIVRDEGRSLAGEPPLAIERDGE